MTYFLQGLVRFLLTPKDPNFDFFSPSLSRSQRVWIVIWIVGALLVVCAILTLIHSSVYMLYAFNFARPFIEQGGEASTRIIKG